MKIAIAGASGLVGAALIPELEAENHDIVRLVRSSPKADEIEWHPNQDSVDASRLEGFDAIINLAGENVAEGRWTEEKKRKIHDSRVHGTHLISEAIVKLTNKPRVFLCASATGIYGDRGDEVLDEQSESGGGFLAGVCREWEKATEPARNAAVRVVNLRFGPILARVGGMLEKMLTPFKMGLGGKVGSGKQYISWVTIEDAVAAMKLALTDESIRGPVNVVSPKPVTNERFTRVLGEVLSRPTVMAMPAFAARLAFGEMADEMLLVSQRVMPKRLQAAGYQFQYSDLESALQHYLGGS
ncbi:MAG TPA: TIGR01777 family oxidoreductase [Pyrinomonadaceae bacterium]|nr:TIGR01777 family oxidoreductase [Pyrinomonadaceae bacterium]